MKWGSKHAKALEETFNGLNESNINWMVLRNHHGLPERNRSKDIDLGLSKENFLKAEKIISFHMKANSFSKKIVEDYQYVRCLTFFNMESREPVAIKIDLLDGFVFRGAQIFDFKKLYSKARPFNNFMIPETIDDALMLLLKPLITGGLVKSNYKNDIESAIKSNPESFYRGLKKIMLSSDAEKLWNLITKLKYSEITHFKTRLRISSWLKIFLSKPIKTLSQLFAHTYFEIKRRTVRRRGVFFAVEGPDGVGKSTFIHSFSKDIATLNIKDSDAVMSCHFRPHLIVNIHELLTGKPEVISEFNDPHSASKVNIFSSFLRLIYYSLDYIFGYWLKIKPHFNRGGLVIFDRYFYDFIVDPARSRLGLPDWVSKFILKFIPEPDIVFLLTANPSLIYSRKQELEINEIERQLSVYTMLANKNKSRFVLIKADDSPESMVVNALIHYIRSLPDNNIL